MNFQIVSLPASSFWTNLRCLAFLYLHDNPIGDPEIVQSLAACSSLTVLTLFDTPLSLGRNYRHNVVNSIWSLKALDHFVVSDDEILEGAQFGSPFCALHPAFAVDLCTPSEVYICVCICSRKKIAILTFKPPPPKKPRKTKTRNAW